MDPNIPQPQVVNETPTPTPVVPETPIAPPAIPQPDLPKNPSSGSPVLMSAIILAAIALISFIIYILWMMFTTQKNAVVVTPTPTSMACTQEAKICPDGSAVGRTGPNCDFAECPVIATPIDTASPSASPVVSPVSSSSASPAY